MRILTALAVLLLMSAPLKAVVITTADGVGADTFIEGGSDANKNFGSGGSMTIKGDSRGGDFTRKIYLRFDVSSLPPNVLDTELLLTTSLNNSGGSNPNPNTFNVDVFGLSNESLDNWVEGNGGTDNSPPGEIVWNNAPANNTSNNNFTGDALSLGSFFVPANPAPDTLSFSSAGLTNFINGDTNGAVTLMLRRQAGGSKNLVLASKENATLAPPTLQVVVPEPTALLVWSLLAALGVGLFRRHR